MGNTPSGRGDTWDKPGISCHIRNRTSSQDGGMGRYALFPHTTKRRTTTSLKTKNNRNWQKIKLFGSPTTKRLKKKHSSIVVGEVETSSQGREKAWCGEGPGRQSSSWQTGWSHICMQINWEEQLGREKDTTQPRVLVWGKQASKPLAIKSCGCCGSRRNSQPHRRVGWRDPHGPRTYTNPLTQESAPEGPNLLVSSRGSDWKPVKSWAGSIVPCQAPPPHTVPQHSNVACSNLANT